MMSILSSIADSVVGIMNNPKATENKLIKIHDFFATNRDVVQAVEELTGGQKY